MRQDIELTSFTKGELTPRLKGRTDYDGYYAGCDTLLNMVVMLQGGATRRPGTLYAANVKTQAKAANLIAFQFNVDQAYMLEFGDLYMRVYKDKAPVTNDLVVTGAANNGVGLIRLTVASTTGLATGNTATVASVGGVPNATGTWLITVISATTFDLVGSTFAGAYTAGGTASVIVEIVTPWTSVQAFELGHAQSADTLYLTHPDFVPRTITRSSHTNWTIAVYTSLDGPYISTNHTTTTATLGATAGATTITFSGVAGINGGGGLLSSDVGRYVRITTGTSWAWMQITAVTTPVVANVNIGAPVVNGSTSPADGVGPTASWALGAWSATTGYPWLVSFFQQRLCFYGTNSEPSRFAGSQPNDFTNHAPTAANGTVNDSNGLNWVIADDQVNAPRWMSATGSSTTPQLAIGTDGAEQILQAGGSAQALTPTSVQAYRETDIGSHEDCPVVRINKRRLFSGFGGRKVYDWSYDFNAGGYLGSDLSVEAEHMTRTGVHQLAYQKRPFSVVWMIRHDGNLVGMTYMQEQGKIIAWHQHRLGGSYYDGPPIVESIACIPATDDTYDELWLTVKRTINGSVVRTVEVMDKYFDDQPQEQAVFMDSSIQSAVVHPAGTLTADLMTLSTGTAQTVITFTVTAATPFVSGDVGSIMRYNDGVALITGFTSTTVLTGLWFFAPTNLAPATTGNWSLTPQSSTFSGLTHLEGEDVQILGDGADFGVETVASAAVSLDPSRGKASFATIGLPITYRLVTMPWSVKGAAAAQGHFKTIATLYLRLYQTLGCSFGRVITDEYTGQKSDETNDLETRNTNDLMGSPPPLQSGIFRVPMPGGYDQEGQMLITGSGPYPTTVLALVASGDVGELPGGG